MLQGFQYTDTLMFRKLHLLVCVQKYLKWLPSPAPTSLLNILSMSKHGSYFFNLHFFTLKLEWEFTKNSYGLKNTPIRTTKMAQYVRALANKSIEQSSISWTDTEEGENHLLQVFSKYTMTSTRPAPINKFKWINKCDYKLPLSYHWDVWRFHWLVSDSLYISFFILYHKIICFSLSFTEEFLWPFLFCFKWKLTFNDNILIYNLERGT